MLLIITRAAGEKFVFQKGLMGKQFEFCKRIGKEIGGLVVSEAVKTFGVVL